MIKLIGFIMFLTAIAVWGGKLRRRHIAERRREARIAAASHYREEFLQQMRRNEIYIAPAQPSKHRNTYFHAAECAKICGGKYLPKGEVI